MKRHGFIRRSVLLTVAASIARDQQARLAARWRMTARSGGTQSAGLSAAANADYVDSAFDGLLRHANFTPEALAGLRVLELGPGDNVGLGFRFLGAGAAAYVALDRFQPRFDAARRAATHRAVVERMTGESRRRADQALAEFERDGGVSGTLRLVYGLPVEQAAATFGLESFDLIFSVAVCEHLYDVPTAFSAMDALLAPGGWLLHQVDLRDHGMFTLGGKSPLEFLTVPDRLYRLMVRHKGGPNRFMAADYRQVLSDLRHDTQVRISRVAGASADLRPYPVALVEGTHFGPVERATVESIRPRLLARYRDASVEDLLTAGLFIASRKKPASAPYEAPRRR